MELRELLPVYTYVNQLVWDHLDACAIMADYVEKVSQSEDGQKRFIGVRWLQLPMINTLTLYDRCDINQTKYINMSFRIVEDHMIIRMKNDDALTVCKISISDPNLELEIKMAVIRGLHLMN